jgi:hypothetical protein
LELDAIIKKEKKAKQMEDGANAKTFKEES